MNQNSPKGKHTHVLLLLCEEQFDIESLLVLGSRSSVSLSILIFIICKAKMFDIARVPPDNSYNLRSDDTQIQELSIDLCQWF